MNFIRGQRILAKNCFLGFIFLGQDLIYATIQLKKAETAGGQWKPFRTEHKTRVSLIQTSFKNAEQSYTYHQNPPSRSRDMKL